MGQASGYRIHFDSGSSMPPRMASLHEGLVVLRLVATWLRKLHVASREHHGKQRLALVALKSEEIWLTSLAQWGIGHNRIPKCITDKKYMTPMKRETEQDITLELEMGGKGGYLIKVAF